MNLQVIVEKTHLDIPANARMQVERINTMLQVGKYTQTRSTQLTLPYTPNNAHVFGLQTQFNAAPEQYKDAGGRVHECAIIMEGWYERGRVYLVSASSSGFVVCLVWGRAYEVLDKTFQEIFGMGVFAQYISELVVNGSDLDNFVGTPYQGLWNIRYQNNNRDYFFPSIGLGALLLVSTAVSMEDYADTQDVMIDIGTTWVVLDKLSGVKDMEGVLPYHSNYVEYPSVSFYGEPSWTADNILTKTLFEGSANYPIWSGVYDGTTPPDNNTIEWRQWTAVRMFQVRQGMEVEIEFPANFPSDVFMIRFLPDINSGMDNIDQSFVFVGGYSFDTEWKINNEPQQVQRAVYGQPLAGRKVTISREENNGEFVFVRRGEFYNETWEHVIAGTTYYRGRFGFINGFVGDDYNVKLTSKVDEVETLTNGLQIYMYHQLPEWSIGEVCNMLCELHNLYYEIVPNESEFSLSDMRVVFYRRELEQVADVESLRNVLSVDKVERKYLDYKRRNVVKFAEDKWERYGSDYSYDMDNESVEDERVLLQFKASAGTATSVENYHNILLRHDLVEYTQLDSSGNAERVIENEAECMAFVEPLWEQLGVQLVCPGYVLSRTRNAVLDNLLMCMQQVTLKVQMSFYRFINLQLNRLLVWRGVYWLWSSARWSDGVVTIILHRYERE